MDHKEIVLAINPTPMLHVNLNLIRAGASTSARDLLRDSFPSDDLGAVPSCVWSREFFLLNCFVMFCLTSWACTLSSAHLSWYVGGTCADVAACWQQHGVVRDKEGDNSKT